MTRIISIQSQVLFGHVGNSAAVPAMRIHGAEVTAVPTTLLSNHPHYPSMRGRLLEPELVADLLLGVEERGLVDEAAVLVTGYMGRPETGDVVAGFVERALRRNPKLLYVCDPVLGDDDLGGFTDPALLEVFRERLVPLAAVATPNGWEARLLAGVGEGAAGLELLAALRGAGFRDMVVTGGSASGERLRALVLDGVEASAVETARLPVRPAGTGDFFTGVLAAELAEGAALPAAAARAMAVTFAMLERTPLAPWAEMPVETALADVLAAAPALRPESIGGLSQISAEGRGLA
ncbi:pyridoxal kinase [Sandaracinobacter sp. RS1-74]|uniref:pyridoxal kinase n=1 Tax=Sandaracinobacteroides sayramensis TaxID=2913411 RepID=UPI001ED9E334|nr:pyridoxal kinase [Sandaracinobacteroides sayramensis]